MACIRTKRYPKHSFKKLPKHSFKKLHARVLGPFRILKKLGSNAYLLELPPEMFISPLFNVEDLMTYRDTFEPPLFSGNPSVLES